MAAEATAISHVAPTKSPLAVQLAGNEPARQCRAREPLRAGGGAAHGPVDREAEA